MLIEHRIHLEKKHGLDSINFLMLHGILSILDLDFVSIGYSGDDTVFKLSRLMASPLDKLW